MLAGAGYVDRKIARILVKHIENITLNCILQSLETTLNQSCLVIFVKTVTYFMKTVQQPVDLGLPDKPGMKHP